MFLYYFNWLKKVTLKFNFQFIGNKASHIYIYVYIKSGPKLKPRKNLSN